MNTMSIERHEKERQPPRNRFACDHLANGTRQGGDPCRITLVIMKFLGDFLQYSLFMYGYKRPREEIQNRVDFWPEFSKPSSRKSFPMTNFSSDIDLFCLTA